MASTMDPLLVTTSRHRMAPAFAGTSFGIRQASAYKAAETLTALGTFSGASHLIGRVAHVDTNRLFADGEFRPRWGYRAWPWPSSSR